MFIQSILISLWLLASTVLSFAHCTKGASSELAVIDSAEVSNTVFVVFKTHLDVGFTDLSSKVEDQYLRNDIPGALKTIEEMRKKYGGQDRFIWTTGTWILSQYLEKATPEERRRLEEAIENGDIVWNAMPYTVESEMASLEIFEGMIKNAKKLDEKYGKQTISANMTDVPGHTRGIVSPLRKAGVRLLHIGLNRSVNIPQIPHLPDYPDICRWQHPDGNSILFLQKKAYGHDIPLPNGNVLSMNVKGDNRGAHTMSEVENIFSNLRKTYPDKKVKASNLNEVAQFLIKYEDEFPVLTGEIGDTWIHGMGSAPNRMAKVRALSRCYRQWIEAGLLDPESNESVRFAVRLGLIAEHTWGADCGKYLKNETPDKYNVDGFQNSRNIPEFLFMEASWKEIDDYIPQAISVLPVSLQQDALDAVENATTVPKYRITENAPANDITPEGALKLEINENRITTGLFTLQTLNFNDFRKWTLSMMSNTGAKSGMNGSQAVSASVHPMVKATRAIEENGRRTVTCKLDMADMAVDNRLYPAEIYVEYDMVPDRRSIGITFTLVNKPANRMAELYWLSFLPENIAGIGVEKMGSKVDVTDVIAGGNARMMAVDRYVDIVTANGTFRIISYDAPLVLIGDRNDMSYKTTPDISKGIHFCLFNNLWGVNYSMWWEGSQQFRFKIEY